MGFGEAIATCFRKYGDFTGRAAPGEYWWFVLFHLLVVAALLLLITPIGAVALVLLIVYGLAVVVPNFAVLVRRLHDTGRSGAYYFVSWIPFVGGIILLVLLVQSGTLGPNQYGPAPARSSQW
jgi:uncharacterized membrane protein YhaH (DUF805 family)